MRYQEEPDIDVLEAHVNTGSKKTWKLRFQKNDGMDYESDNEDHATIVTSYAEQRLI